MKQLLILITLFVALTVCGQRKSDKTPYGDFIEKFNLRFDTVSWLCEYDNIAWWTSDSVYASSKEEKEKLGREWFCFYQNNFWHAVYGKYNDNNFNMVFHYIVDSTNHIKRTWEEVDSLLLNSYSRAIFNAGKLIRSFPDSSKIRFNQYIKRNKDQTFSVWLLPAFTANNIAVYGGEFYYLFDKSGNNLLARNEYSIGYHGFKPDIKKEIIIDYSAFDEPPLSAVFFAWYYKDYFKRITIDTKKFRSAALRDINHFTWVHASKEN